MIEVESPTSSVSSSPSHPDPHRAGNKMTDSSPKPSPWGQPAVGSSPWGHLAAASPAPCSLQDVMSEELAKELQIQEEKKNHPEQEQSEPDIDLSKFQDLHPEGADSTDSDFLLAQMLQHQFDKEYDSVLSKTEAKYNGNSKVKMSFEKYRVVHPALRDEDKEESDDDEPWEEEVGDTAPKFNKRGISGKGANIITKHDLTLDGRKNAKNMENFPLKVEVGDGSDFDMRVPSHVYNKLKSHSLTVNKREMKLQEKKDHSTAEMAVDEKTRLILYKLMNGGVLEQVNGVVSTGKESVIIHAKGGRDAEEPVPNECALKVFKTTLTDFKNRAQYVKGDIRYFKDEFKKQNPRRIMKIWAQKEDNNLRRLGKHGIPCPKVVLLRKHVLVMEFIGEDNKPAPKLRDAKLSTVDMQMAYEQCIENMKKMYRKAGLVHADLSEFNLLWHKDTLYFIDVSQAVERMHPHAAEFLLRDCVNICGFFRKAGVPDVPTPYQLFNDITGLDFQGEGKDFLAQIEEYERNEERLRLGTGMDYAFEFFFEKAQKEREATQGAKAEGHLSEEDSSEESAEEATQGDVSIETGHPSSKTSSDPPDPSSQRRSKTQKSQNKRH